MAYVKQNWECGDIVTADKLNNIERGIAEVNSEYVPTTWQCGDLITAEAMNKIEQGVANASGGSSDFSTATVTVVGNVNAVVPYVITTEMGAPFDALVALMQNVESGSQIPLYKGKLMIEIATDGVTVSGNIESLGNRMYLITGDCTITIS